MWQHIFILHFRPNYMICYIFINQIGHISWHNPNNLPGGAGRCVEWGRRRAEPASSSRGTLWSYHFLQLYGLLYSRSSPVCLCQTFRMNVSWIFSYKEGIQAWPTHAYNKLTHKHSAKGFIHIWPTSTTHFYKEMLKKKINPCRYVSLIAAHQLCSPWSKQSARPTRFMIRK